MRCLIVSDIHANIDALMALDESWNKFLFLGDAVDYGAAPEEAISWMRAQGALGVRGNHDHAMATGADCRSSPLSYALSVATRAHFRPLLSGAALEYLGALPMRRTVEVPGTRLHLVHATPRDPLYEYLAGDQPEAAWREAVGDLADREEWLFVGHTHRPFQRRIGCLSVVNPGSLGMPVDGDVRACYAVWEDGRVELKRAPYDVEAAVARLHSSGLAPGVCERMAEVLRRAARG